MGGYTKCTLTCNCQSTVAASAATVYLQIYKINGATWETLTSDSTTAANTDFNLVAPIYDLTDYKDGSGVITCRVYQQVP